ncbi:MAG: polysaccharide biosynthesis tyrosine autokinase, partial [Prochlorotrichaceae cyanobacterium]
YALLQRQVGASPDVALASAALSESPNYQGLLKQVQELESKIATESARFQMDSPQIQSLMERRSNLVQLTEIEAQRVLGGSLSGGLNDRMTSIPLDLTKQLVQVANKIQVLQVRGQALVAAENQLKQEFSIIPDLSRQYTDLQRQLEIATESLNRFLATQEQLQIEASQQAEPWQILAAPSASSTPISPGLSRNLLGGALAGLALGVAVGLLRDRMDYVFHSVEELKEVTRLPILGLLPHCRDIEQLQTGLATSVGQQGSQISALYRQPEETYSSSPFQEAFRVLYSNLKFLSSDTSIRSVAISSSLPGDGKSTTSLYLAQAAAAMGQRVLIVDADMRRPQLHSRLGLSNMKGLSNILASGLSADDVIQLADANLSILTAGQIPPDPTKLLSSHRMASLVEQFENSFDLVIYDTPPLLGLADATLLAAHTDGLVLVVGLGKTDRSAFDNVLDHLKLSAVPLLGLVANGITESSNYSNGYYYYRSYYNNRPDEAKEKVARLAEHN